MQACGVNWEAILEAELLWAGEAELRLSTPLHQQPSPPHSSLQ